MTVNAPPPTPLAYPSTQVAERTRQTATRIVEQTGVTRGYALVLGAKDGRLAYELAKRTELHMVCVDSDATRAAATRTALHEAGMAGRIVVHHLPADQPLPYTDYLFNLVVSGSLATEGRFTGNVDEAKRVLRPHGGVLVMNLTDEGRDHPGALFRRGPLPGVGEWTHLYADAANTVCSGDEHVNGPLALQWFGPPGPRRMLDRHLRSMSPVWKAGRLFIPGNDMVFAVDAYNGTPLWSAELTEFRRMAIFRDCGSMAATDDTLYVAAGNVCIGFDAATGRRKTTFTAPTGPGGEKRDWGYLAVVGDTLIATACKPGASRREENRKVIATQTYWDFVPIVGSDEVFALDRRSGDVRWRYASKAGLMMNPTITVADGRIYFVESDNADTLQRPDGRATPADLLGKGSRIVALDLVSGSVTWQRAHDFSAIQHNLYLTAAQGKLVAVGSRNSGTNRKTDKVLYDVATFNAADGTPKWATTQNQGTVINGDHGEQDHHPVVVGDRLYVEPFAYELHTGKLLAGWAWRKQHRRGCGTIAASASTFFFRNKHASMFDLASNTYAPVTTTTRPGCWINMIPAGGLLLVPEASSGCTCDFAVQASVAFLPRGRLVRRQP